MSETAELNWPEVVTVPDAIGAHHVYDAGGNPCCSLGHADVYLGQGSLMRKWRKAFVRCHETLTRQAWSGDGDGLGLRNDEMTPGDRRLVYAAAWLYLGVKIDREFPEAEELARRAGA